VEIHLTRVRQPADVEYHGVAKNCKEIGESDTNVRGTDVGRIQYVEYDRLLTGKYIENA